jgi:hypothetical protein
MRVLMARHLDAAFSLGSEFFNIGAALVAKANMKLMLAVLYTRGGLGRLVRCK